MALTTAEIIQLTAERDEYLAVLAVELFYLKTKFWVSKDSCRIDLTTPDEIWSAIMDCMEVNTQVSPVRNALLAYVNDPPEMQNFINPSSVQYEDSSRK